MENGNEDLSNKYANDTKIASNKFANILTKFIKLFRKKRIFNEILEWFNYKFKIKFKIKSKDLVEFKKIT